MAVMGDLGFMHNDIVQNGTYDITYNYNGGWDRQTIVMMCQSAEDVAGIRKLLGRRRSPSSRSQGNGYQIDVYTNLNYEAWERDPAKRNVRIVYCDMNIMRIKEINDRFPNSYMLIVRRGDKKYGSKFISGEISQAPRNGGCTQEIRRNNPTRCIEQIGNRV